MDEHNRPEVDPRSGSVTAERERTAERVVADYLDAFGRHDVEALGRMCTDDIVEMLAGIPPLEGIDAELGFARELFGAFPDLEVEVTRLMGVDQVVAAAWTRRGTFTGSDFQGLPSNGARFESEAAGFFEIDNGLVKRVTVYFDMNKFARDLGLAPAEGSLAERLAMGMFRARVRTNRLFGGRRGRKRVS